MATDSHHSDLGLLGDTSFWVAASFVLFVIVLWKMGRKAIVSGLDARIEKIQSDVKTAENLRREAQELLSQYQEKQKDAEKEAERILDDAKKNANEIRRNAERELKETLNRKEQQLEERLSRMKDSTIQDIQAYAANLAIKATSEIVMDSLDKKTSERLIDEAISDLEKIH